MIYERMKYITQEQKDQFEALLASDNPNVSELQKAISVLLDQVDVMGAKAYDPKFGATRLCKCGHPYYRHFDTYEDMAPVGCKYCGYDCPSFRDSGKVQCLKDGELVIEDYVEKT